MKNEVCCESSGFGTSATLFVYIDIQRYKQGNIEMCFAHRDTSRVFKQAENKNIFAYLSGWRPGGKKMPT